MKELTGATRRLDAGRRLLTNSRLARAALSAGFRSLPAVTVAHLLRRSTSGAELLRPKHHGEASVSRIAMVRGAPFAGYTILRSLGAGGMAEVYLALHPRLPRRDVIKVLAGAVTADRQFRERFNREADLAATLWHPHIVGVHDRGEFAGQLWISMDYVEGTDAARLLKERYRDGMPVDEVCAILHAVAGALDYAHDHGLLHRDVKPANILLTHIDGQERRILLADFGVARHLGNISGITETNVAVGTIAYAAPEQLIGSHIDGRSDQYALAATAFHLLTGFPPFRHSNPVAVIGQHLHDAPPRLSDYRPDLAHLDDLFCQALAKNPEERFERCRTFSAAVGARVVTRADFVGAEPPGRRISRGVSAGAHKLSRRARIAVVLVCAVLAAATVAWWTRFPVAADSSQLKPALAARPAAPARVLNGTYRLDYDRSKRTANGIPVRHDGVDTSWWAFRSTCTANACAATGVQLDDTNHQVISIADGGPADVLRFVAGYWQGTPQQQRVDCRPQNGPAHATQAETSSWSLAPQADGTLRGLKTETVLDNECGAQGAVLRIPVVATRVGDVPPNLAFADPAQLLTAPAAAAGVQSPPVLGGLCNDVDKLGYDQTSNEQVVCEGNTWDKAPIATGVHAVGSSCDRPDIPVFATSISSDGYLLQCDPITRIWTRHR